MSRLEAFWNKNIDPFNWRNIEEIRLSDAWHEAVATYLSPEMRHAVSCMGPLHGKRILLLGAGLGQGAVQLARMGAEVVGLDVAKRRCMLAKEMVFGGPEEKKISFVVSNASCLPFPDGSFHLVLDQDVLMYTSKEEAIRECRRVLAVKGKAVFVESIEGHPILKLFRRSFYGREMRRLTHHLTYEDMEKLFVPGLSPTGVKGFYFLSIIAFGMLYFFRATLMYRLSLALLYPVDRLLLIMLPRLSRHTWKAVAVYHRNAVSCFEKRMEDRESLF